MNKLVKYIFNISAEDWQLAAITKMKEELEFNSQGKTRNFFLFSSTLSCTGNFINESHILLEVL